jgi:molecular chaperone DnaK (HSP70)
MKRIQYLAAIAAALAFTFAGCSKDGSVDTSKVEASFSSADASAKGDLDQVLTALKAGDFATATAPLQKLASNAKLTPEQQAAAKDLLTQVQEKVKEVAAKATEEATEAMKKAKSEAGDALKKAQDGAGDAVNKARESTGDALKTLGDKVKP